MAPMTPAMAQLRATFPQAALISELLTVQDGRFVVRALVQVGDHPLASGMAAATDIEQAEDRAKERAIQALGLQPSAVGAIAPTPTVSSPSLPGSAPPTPTPAPTTPTSPSNVPVADLYSHIATSQDGEMDEVPPPLPPMQRASDLKPPKSGSRKSAKTTPSELPSQTQQDSANSHPSGHSVDLSDVIAQTDVEMRRLGWDANMGRAYLEKTYNKRSRGELSELELYEFLSYLTAQPNPT